jgi:hypothetical protein
MGSFILAKYVVASRFAAKQSPANKRSIVHEEIASDGRPPSLQRHLWEIYF